MGGESGRGFESPSLFHPVGSPYWLPQGRVGLQEEGRLRVETMAQGVSEASQGCGWCRGRGAAFKGIRSEGHAREGRGQYGGVGR